MADRIRAIDLPAGSVAATRRLAYIKKVAHPGTPGEERYWVAAQTYAWPMTDQQMQHVMDRDDVQVLRVGDGTAGEG